MSAPRDIIAIVGVEYAPYAERVLTALAAAGYVLVQRPPGVDRVVVEWTRHPCAECRGRVASISVESPYSRREIPNDCSACGGSGWGPTGVQIRTLVAAGFSPKGSRLLCPFMAEFRPDCGDMPVWALVDLPVAEKPTP